MAVIITFDKVAQVVPFRMQSLTFGLHFDQSIEKVSLTAGLRNITVDTGVSMCRETGCLPKGLQSLTFGGCF